MTKRERRAFRVRATRKQVRRSSEMVYENFIVGPRCSAVVFKVLSRRLRFASPRPGSGRGRGGGWRKKGLRILFFKRVKRAGGTPGFIKVVWHICSRRLLPSSADRPTPTTFPRIILFIISLKTRASSFERGLKGPRIKNRAKRSGPIHLASVYSCSSRAAD